jgi:hypothetical protein
MALLVAQVLVEAALAVSQAALVALVQLMLFLVQEAEVVPHPVTLLRLN